MQAAVAHSYRSTFFSDALTQPQGFVDPTQMQDALSPSQTNNPFLASDSLSPFSRPCLTPPSSDEDESTGFAIIDTFVPRSQQLSPDGSPVSSLTGSDIDSRIISAQFTRAAIQAFFATRSRVVRLYNLPPSPEAVLSAVFHPLSASKDYCLGRMPIPASLWRIREEYATHGPASIWAVFSAHDEACAALSLSGLPFAVATALESDLEPFHKLKRFVLRPCLSSSPSPHPPIDLSRPFSMLRVSTSHPNLLSSSPTIVIEEPRGGSTDYYTLSTNPPNPKTSFRLGDWICPSPNCAAHNFGRNLSCIGCGCPKLTTAPGQHQNQQQSQQLYSTSNNSAPRTAASPRFSNPPNPSAPLRSSVSTNQPAYTSSCSQPQPSRSMGYQSQASGPPKTAHPLLTPSGRAFAQGGRVQNVSSDPLSPCIMYWPDNEPFPEQGQIRPGGLAGVPQPPILNTGNKGPISHQPGDWICKKCNYLNWRRRKVCQTCLPYAEGNGDAISAAVQAERIALLTSVLAQTQLSSNALGGDLMQSTQHQQPVPRTNSMTPPLSRRPYVDMFGVSLQPQASDRPVPQLQHRPIHKSQSHTHLGGQFAHHVQVPSVPSPQYTAPSPIYQTSGHRQPSPLYSTGPVKAHITTPDGQRLQRFTPSPSSSRSSLHGQKIETPAPLLPSFLQDIVQSPALSPTSTTTTTTSSDITFEDEYEEVMNSRNTFPRVRGASGSGSIGGLSDGGGSSSSMMNSLSIWKLDGQESKSLRGFPLPIQQDSMVTPGPGVIGAGRKGVQASM